MEKPTSAAAIAAPGPALDVSAARQTVVEFVEAYRASPDQGIGPLEDLVVGPDLASWVTWLDVQHREFDGTIRSHADVRDVEFIGALATPSALLASVGLSASVDFRFEPSGDDPIDLVRVLDGPVTLIRSSAGTYQVQDLLRNGVPMSDSIELFRNQERTAGDVSVRLDSLFMFPPNWQFNVSSPARREAASTPGCGVVRRLDTAFGVDACRPRWVCRPAGPSRAGVTRRIGGGPRPVLLGTGMGCGFSSLVTSWRNPPPPEDETLAPPAARRRPRSPGDPPPRCARGTCS
jgi:hypothetical protein